MPSLAQSCHCRCRVTAGAKKRRAVHGESVHFATEIGDSAQRPSRQATGRGCSTDSSIGSSARRNQRTRELDD